MTKDQRNPVEELAEEFLSRLRRGEEPAVSEYVEKYPEWSEEIQDLFPAMLMMEQLKPGSPGSTRGAPLTAGVDLDLSQLGDYRILREVGRGGMGIVYEAEQESLGRRVAVKVLPPGSLTSPRRLARFKQEARAAAMLHHTNIVQVFGVGEQDGHHYYVMQYIEGRGLDEVLGSKDGSLDYAAAVRIALQAARALDHAHSRGTLHRDIKPANLLLDPRGTVWITDFGLAKVLSEEKDLTDTGDLVGTIRYMPPERFEGKSDARGDVYGLGLTLYELLSGRPAFADRDHGSVIRAIREEGPTEIRSLAPGIPPDLGTIVMKAVALGPEERYATAGELAADLERFIAGRPILARRAGPIERAWRWCKRNRAVAVLSVVTGVCLLFAAAVGWAGYLVTTKALNRAEENEQMSLEALEEIFDSLAGVDRIMARGRPGPTGERSEESDAELLQSVLTFYDRFAAKNDTDPRLRLETAKAHRRVGMLRARLGDGDGARTAFSRSVEALEDLSEEFPSEATYRVELVTSLCDSIAMARGETPSEDMVDDCSRAVGIASALRDEDPHEPLRADLLSAAHARHAVVLANSGRGEDAEVSLDVAVEVRKEASERFGEEKLRPGYDIAMARASLAASEAREGRHDKAIALLLDAIEDTRGRGRPEERGRGDPRIQMRLWTALAASYRATGREREAEDAEGRVQMRWERRGGPRDRRERPQRPR